MVFFCNTAVSHVAGHFLSLFGASAHAGICSESRDRALCSMLSFRAVRGRESGETVSLHRAGETFAFAGTHNVDKFIFCKSRDRDGVSDFVRWLDLVGQPHLSDKSLGSDICLLSMSDLRLLHARGLYIVVAHLNCIIAVCLAGFNLHNCAGPSLYDGDGHQATRLVVQPGHPNFFAQ